MSSGGHKAGTAVLARHRADPLTAAVKHGVYLKGFMPCRRCVARDECPQAGDGEATCALEREYYDWRVKVLAGIPHVDPELDMPAIVSAAWAEIRAARGRMWLAAVGEFRFDGDKLEYQPSAVEVRRLQAEARSALAEIGATPMSRKKLEATERDPKAAEFLAILRGAEEIERKQQAEAAQDAEFEAEGEDEGGDGSR
jgi:hypothetical protein